MTINMRMVQTMATVISGKSLIVRHCSDGQQVSVLRESQISGQYFTLWSILPPDDLLDSWQQLLQTNFILTRNSYLHRWSIQFSCYTVAASNSNYTGPQQQLAISGIRLNASNESSYALPSICFDENKSRKVVSNSGMWLKELQRQQLDHL